MNDELEKLRPEVRDALAEIQGEANCRCSEPYKSRGMKDPQCNHDLQDSVDVVRAELLRLTGENARLNKIESLATEQRLQMEGVELYLMDVSQPDDENAPWCDRMKSAIELLIQDCNDAVGQKNKAEAELATAQNTINAQQDTMGALKQKLALSEGELAAFKARMFRGIVLDVDDLARGHAGLPSEWRGKRVLLVVEE